MSLQQVANDVEPQPCCFQPPIMFDCGCQASREIPLWIFIVGNHNYYLLLSVFDMLLLCICLYMFTVQTLNALYCIAIITSHYYCDCLSSQSLVRTWHQRDLHHCSAARASQLVANTGPLLGNVSEVYVDITMRAAKENDATTAEQYSRESVRIARTTRELLKKFAGAYHQSLGPINLDLLW